MDTCDVKRCGRTDIELIYYGRTVCYKHWLMHCDENNPFNLKKEFGIKPKKKPLTLRERLMRIKRRREEGTL